MDPRTDIYAVGIMAYEMLTGQKPFAAEDPRQLEDMHLNRDIPDPLLSVADLPEGLQGFIVKSGRRDPNLRYKDMQQVLADLKDISAALRGGRAHPAAPTDSGRANPNRR